MRCRNLKFTLTAGENRWSKSGEMATDEGEVRLIRKQRCLGLIAGCALSGDAPTFRWD
jgi:hypothetical protein